MSVLLPKAVRLRVFLDRLAEASPASSALEAKQLIDRILNAVEDELTDAIEIRDPHTLEVLLAKPGLDGKGVWS
jgi:hypothetical protein